MDKETATTQMQTGKFYLNIFITVTILTYTFQQTIKP